MTPVSEFWLAYQFTSRGNVPPTAQLIDLEHNGQKLCDLEDVLEYVFKQNYVEPCFRSVTTWARRDGVPVHPSDSIDDLLKQGVGKCTDNAIRLVVEDTPAALWFTYFYVHSPEAKVSVQRIRLNQTIKFEHIAHLTNYIFHQGYLPSHYRPLVHWKTHCGKKLAEDARVVEALGNGFGVCDAKAIKLIIDAHPCHTHHHCGSHHHHHHLPCPCSPTHQHRVCPF